MENGEARQVREIHSPPEQLFPSAEKVGIRYIVSIQISKKHFLLKKESKEGTMLPWFSPSLSLSESRKFLSRLVTIFFLRLKTWDLNSLINKSKRNSFGDHRVHSLIRDKEIEASLDRKSNRPFPFY